MEIATNQIVEALQGVSALNALVQEILEIKASVLSEASDEERHGGKKRRHRKSGKKHKKDRDEREDDDEEEDDRAHERFAKHEKANKERKAEKKVTRGKLHTIKNIPAGHHIDTKTHKIIHSTGKHGNQKFANATTFRSTRSDAHLHTDADCNQGLRGRTPPEMYAKHASAEELKKHPCKKSYPIFPMPGDRARIAGSARMAAVYKDPTVIDKIKSAGEKIGMHIHGNLWNERPECKEYARSGRLPEGWSKKDCEPHGEGGADEWLRKFRVHKSREGKLKHAPIMRHKSHPGKKQTIFRTNRETGKREAHVINKRQLPGEHMDDHLYAKHGGHWGEKAVQYGRNLPGFDRFGKAGWDGHHIEGHRWARHKLQHTGIRHNSKIGHATTGSPNSAGSTVKRNFRHTPPRYRSKGEHKAAIRAARAARGQ